MKIFVCLLVLGVASCKAGFESGGFEGHGDGNTGFASSGGYDYNAPIGGGDFSGAQGGSHPLYTSALTQGHGHEFPSFNSGGHGGQDFSGFQGGQGHEFSNLQGGQGHDFSGPGQSHNFGGQFAGQFGHGSAGLSGGDSYLQAAEASAHQDGHGLEDEGQNEGGHEGQGHEQFQGIILQDGGQEFGHGGGDQNVIVEDGGYGHNFGGQNFGGHNFGQVEAVPVGEHTDVESPVQVPLYKHVTVPVHKPLHINVPKPILVGVPQPYPVKVPVHKPVAVPVETEISIPVEKVVPYPVVKHVPYPVEKHVPVKVEKTVTVHVPQPYPVKIPVFKTIHHHKH